MRNNIVVLREFQSTLDKKKPQLEQIEKELIVWIPIFFTFLGIKSSTRTQTKRIWWKEQRSSSSSVHRVKFKRWNIREVVHTKKSENEECEAKVKQNKQIRGKNIAKIQGKFFVIQTVK